MLVCGPASATVTPLTGAPFEVTMPERVWVTDWAAVIVMAAIAEVPLAAAVTITEVELVTALAVTVKLDVVRVAATVMEAGVARDALSSDRVTAVPPAGATAVSVTVQVAEAKPVTDEGAQVSDETPTELGAGGVRLIGAFLELPFNAAVTVAV